MPHKIREASLLLTCPDEILLNIAHRLRANDLRSLALLNTRFRGVSQECLFQDATISPARIFNFIDGVHRAPVLENRVAHLRIGTVDEEVSREMMEMQPIYKNMPLEGYNACGGIIRAATPHGLPLSWLFALYNEPDFYSVGVSLLIAQLKALNTLSVSTSAIDNIQILKLLFYRKLPPAEEDDIPPWMLGLQSLVHKRLTTLVIKLDQGTWERQRSAMFYGRIPFDPSLVKTSQGVYELAMPDLDDSLDLLSFSSLNSLELPGIHVENQSLDILEVLPSSLKTLVIHFGRIEYEWIDFTWSEDLIMSSDHPKHLQSIELHFDLNLYSQTFRIGCLMNCRNQLIALDKAMKQRQINFKTYFGHVKLAQLGDGPRIGEVTAWKPGCLVEAIDYFIEHKITLGTNDDKVLKDWGFNPMPQKKNVARPKRHP